MNGSGVARLADTYARVGGVWAPEYGPPLARYTIAIGTVVVAFLLRLALGPILEADAPYLPFIPAVLVAAGIGGLGPGLLATVLSVAGVFYVTTLFATLSWASVLNAVAFAAIGVASAWIGERLMQARRQASQRQAHLESILDTVPDAVVVTDEEGIMRYFSRAAERIFGYRRREAIGRSVSLLMPPPEREEHGAHIMRYLQTGDCGMVDGTAQEVEAVRKDGTAQEVEAVRKDGTAFPVEIVVGEMKSAGQRYFTAFMHDITKRRDDERKMRELQNELVQVSRLTAMGEMSSSLAHELNQPLSTITNYLHGARKLLANPAESNLPMLGQALDGAAEQALRAGEVIRRLRDFVSRGHNERRVESVSKIVEEASTLGLAGARELGISVGFLLDPAHDKVVADRIQVEQVLINLLRNAVEALEGSERREIVVTSSAGEDDRVEISVTDSGPGLEPHVAAHLFEPFITSKAHGMGVGLSICRTVVESQGGRIWAESGPEGGCLFRFTLPRAKEEEPESV